MRYLGLISLLGTLALPITGTAAAACAPPPGLESVFANGKRIVMFGDNHGTNEIPDFVGRVVCALAQRGRESVVGLEFPRGLQGSVDAFLRSRGTPADRAAFLKSPFWTGFYQDGRRSEAMLRLFDRLRAIKQQHPQLTLVSFDIGKGVVDEDSGKPRDIAMADAFRRALDRASPKAVGIIFVGNYHAARAGLPNGMKSMVLELDRNGDTLALTEADSGGTAYNLQSDGEGIHKKGPLQCGGGNPEKPAIIVKETRLRDVRWDGCFFVGPVTASMPAVKPEDRDPKPAP